MPALENPEGKVNSTNVTHFPLSLKRGVLDISTQKTPYLHNICHWGGQHDIYSSTTQIHPAQHSCLHSYRCHCHRYWTACHCGRCRIYHLGHPQNWIHRRHPRRHPRWSRRRSVGTCPLHSPLWTQRSQQCWEQRAGLNMGMLHSQHKHKWKMHQC